MRADLDALRAASELMRRQGAYVAQIVSYMNQNCRASSAFTGPTILSLFEGSYEHAFGFMSEGLATSERTCHGHAEKLTACADAYRQADEGSHNAFATVGGRYDLHLASSYRDPGSGVQLKSYEASVEMSSEPEQLAKPPWLAGVPGVGVPGVGGALAGADSVRGYYNDNLQQPVDFLVDQSVDGTAMHFGRRVFQDDLDAQGIKADYAAQSGTEYLDGRLKGVGDAAGVVANPVGHLYDKGQEKFAEWAAGKTGMEDRLRPQVDDLGNQQRGADPEYHAAAERAHRHGENVQGMRDTYDAANFVLDNRNDPTLGLKDTWSGLQDNWKDLEAARDLRAQAKAAIAAPNSFGGAT